MEKQIDNIGMINYKRIIFVSSRQNELQYERDELRDFINKKDELLSKLFVARTFEVDLAGRKESINEMVREWVLKSHVYLGIFDREYSEVTAEEYYIAIGDKIVTKEIMIFIRSRMSTEREPMLSEFLAKLMDTQKGHSCVIFNNTQDLLNKAKQVLLSYKYRITEGFPLTKDALGPNLDIVRNTDFPEILRRKLLQPSGRYMIPRGRKNVPEYYKFDENGQKIDITWEFIINEPNIANEVKDFYRERYMKLLD